MSDIRFWLDMIHRDTLKRNDKLLVGNIDEGIPSYIDLSELLAVLTTDDLPEGDVRKYISPELKEKLENLSEDLLTLASANKAFYPRAENPAGYLTSESSISADKIIGILAAARIPDLPASKIVSGILAAARIPELPASKIGSGVFDVERIPTLPSSKIEGLALELGKYILKSAIGDANGVAPLGTDSKVPIGHIPDLDASKVKSGIFSEERIPAIYVKTSDIIDALSSNDPGLPLSANQGRILKEYIDGLAQGVKWKDSVLCATTENIVLSGEQVIDGIQTAASRILVKDQNDPSQNGIYQSTEGEWLRTEDADLGAELINATVVVEEGVENGKRQFKCNSGEIEIGVTPIEFVGFSSIVNHNETTGKQGGQPGEYFHLTESEKSKVEELPEGPVETVTGSSNKANAAQSNAESYADTNKVDKDGNTTDTARTLRTDIDKKVNKDDVEGTNSNADLHSIAQIGNTIISETVTQLGNLPLEGNVLPLTLRNENGVTQRIDIDLSELSLTDNSLANAIYNASTNIITLTEDDGSTHQIDLSEFSIQVNTDANGVTTLTQEGVVKATISRVGQTGDHNHLLNLPVNATTTADGLMSKEDKARLENLNNDFATKYDKSGGTIDGDIEVTRLSKQAGIYSIENGIVRVNNPKGATLGIGNLKATGAIKIKLPARSTSTMMHMLVDVFIYSDNDCFSVLIGGYNYSGDGRWRAASVQVLASDSVKDIAVRYGNDGQNDCIWLGDLNSVWEYPKVSVRKFQGAGGALDSRWAENWSISLESSFGTVDVERRNNFPFADFNKLKGKTATAEQLVLGDGTGKKVSDFFRKTSLIEDVNSVDRNSTIISEIVVNQTVNSPLGNHNGSLITFGGLGAFQFLTVDNNKPEIRFRKFKNWNGDSEWVQLHHSGNLKIDGPNGFWSGTQSEYDAISTKDANTIYFIT